MIISIRNESSKNVEIILNDLLISSKRSEVTIESFRASDKDGKGANFAVDENFQKHSFKIEIGSFIAIAICFIFRNYVSKIDSKHEHFNFKSH